MATGSRILLQAFYPTLIFVGVATCLLWNLAHFKYELRYRVARKRSGLDLDPGQVTITLHPPARYAVIAPLQLLLSHSSRSPHLRCPTPYFLASIWVLPLPMPLPLPLAPESLRYLSLYDNRYLRYFRGHRDK